MPGGAVLRELDAPRAKPRHDEEDSDDCEEWVANSDGSFHLAKATAAPLKKSRKLPPSPRSSSSLPHSTRAVLTVLVAAIGVGCYRGDAFWCGARGIPLGTAFTRSGFSLGQMPYLAGRVALVTGANTGLGLEVARQLAKANCSVVLACRDPVKCAAAASTVIRYSGGAAPAVTTVDLDLGSLQSVAKGAARVRRQLRSLHMLVLNAGVATQFPLTTTADGIERTFQANYLGHFALVRELKSLLEASARRSRTPSRVVHLTSGAHRGAPAEGVPLSLAAINGPMGAYARYGTAKLANLVFAQELARRSPKKLLVSTAVHPGVVATEMLRMANFASMLGPGLGHMAWLLAKIRNLLFAYWPRTAAVSVLYAAVGATTEIIDEGQLIVPIATHWRARHPMAFNATFARELWHFSERLVRDARRARRRSRDVASHTSRL